MGADRASAGVHQKDEKDAIRFASLEPWPGAWIGAEGRYTAEDGTRAPRRNLHQPIRT